MNKNHKNRIVIISIMSYYAQQIFNETKLYEFRKSPLKEDLLDYFGISKESKVNYQKLYTLYSIRLNVNEKIVSKFNQMPRKRDPRVMISIINQKLDDMVRDTMNLQKNNLKILQQADEIKGLIIDLMQG